MRILTRASRWALRQPRRLYHVLRLEIELPRQVAAVREALRDGTVDFETIRSSTLKYVAANRVPELGPGRYSYAVGGPPLVYASAYAALARHLYGDLESLSDDESRQWASYLLSHQSDDGVFRDPQISCDKAETLDWWGWRHMTLHVLMALCTLKAGTARPFACLERFRSPGGMADWLAHRRWIEDASCVSNEVQNVGTMLQYARDHQGVEWCAAALDEMYEWLDARQDPATGCWHYPACSPRQRSLAVQTGYHFWCLYFYDNRPIRHVERIIDTCLATQNRHGGFGVASNSSACEDIDSIDPLARLSQTTSYRHEEIRECLERALPWVLANRNSQDGGWVFRRAQPYNIVPHKAMRAGCDKSFMAYTWFRTLSLAYLAKALPDSPVAKGYWRLDRFPGHQFWVS